MTDDKTTEIRKLNDVCRQQIFVPQWMRPYPCQVVHTQGIEGFSEDERYTIYETVGKFSDFSEDNDPHQEHDFGAFDFKGQKIFWKIDYYAHDLQHGSEDPSDPKQTMRVLTILLASEY